MNDDWRPCPVCGKPINPRLDDCEFSGELIGGEWNGKAMRRYQTCTYSPCGCSRMSDIEQGRVVWKKTNPIGWGHGDDR